MCHRREGLRDAHENADLYRRERASERASVGLGTTGCLHLKVSVGTSVAVYYTAVLLFAWCIVSCSCVRCVFLCGCVRFFRESSSFSGTSPGGAINATQDPAHPARGYGTESPVALSSPSSRNFSSLALRWCGVCAACELVAPCEVLLGSYIGDRRSLESGVWSLWRKINEGL